MQGKYKVITLCGSTRFKKEFIEVQKRLTLEGNIVISVGLFGHAGDEEVWEGMDEGTLTHTKAMLDDMHKSKIDMADEIFVINVDGYIGESTRSEIEYAKSKRKVIRYLEEIKIADLKDTIYAIDSGVDYKTGEKLDTKEILQDSKIKATIESLYKKMFPQNEDEKGAEPDSRSTEEDQTTASISPHRYMIDAYNFKETRDFSNAIKLYKRALESGPDEFQRSIIIGNIIESYFELGFADRANNYYIAARHKYGRDVVDYKKLTGIASLLVRKGDLHNAKKYSGEAYNLSDGNPSVVLQDMVSKLWGEESSEKSKKEKPKETISSSNKKNEGKEDKTTNDKRKVAFKPTAIPKEKKEFKRSCKNCKLYIRDDCSGLDGLCDSYQYAPVITDEEKETWPWEMGPYVTGYGPKKKW